MIAFGKSAREPHLRTAAKGAISQTRAGAMQKVAELLDFSVCDAKRLFGGCA